MADKSFIDGTLAAKLELSLRPLHSASVAKSLNGRQLTDVTHVSALVSLLTSANDNEFVWLHIIDPPHGPVVLDLPRNHNLHMDWVNKILGWSLSCPLTFAKPMLQSFLSRIQLKNFLTGLPSHMKIWTLVPVQEVEVSVPLGPEGA